MSKKNKFFLLKRVLFFVGNILLIVFSSLSMLICTSIIWMFKTWPYLSMEELMFQIQSPAEGTSHDLIEDFMSFCIPVTVLFSITVIVLLITLYKQKKRLLFFLTGLFFLSIVLIATSAYVAWDRLDIGGYIENGNTYSDFIDENYADPDTTTLVFPEQKRNLIYIFLESMETTYSDTKNGGAFEDNYIPELTELAEISEDFSGEDESLNGGIPMNYSTWTMAALFAQTSGLPLTIPIDMNDMDTQNSFLPDLTTLGDILESQGYNQTFMIGSYSNFGGRRQYFTDHGNFNIKDYDYCQKNGLIPEDYWVWWGFEDEKLFDFAKTELTELASQDEPFNLTMLTVDTHFEDGYVCELCGTEHGDDTYGNVLSCSSRQVYDFVKWIQEQDFYENTTIVISGDHLTMDSDFCENVDSDYD